jgi:hypothetical protein
VPNQARLLPHLLEKGQQGFISHLVTTLNLTDDQFRIKGDGQLGTSLPQGFFQTDE